MLRSKIPLTFINYHAEDEKHVTGVLLFVLVLGFTTHTSTVHGTNWALQAVTLGVDSFSTDLFKKILKEKPQENVVCSPLSAHLVLSMATYGADGDTVEQMGKSLHLPRNFNVAYQGFQSLVSNLQSVPWVTLEEITNKMFVANNLDINPKYRNLMANMFKSEISAFDTQRPVESAELINQWVENLTNNKIHDIVESDDINSSSSLMLLSAVYLQGSWAEKFEKKATRNVPFYVNKEKQILVPTMYMHSSFKTGRHRELDARFLELPYENKELKMVIILPNKIDGLSYIEQNLDSLASSRFTRPDAYGKTPMDLLLPRFKIETTIDLQQPLEELGMSSIFGNTANFSGIAQAPLRIGKVLQKAFIEVNEEGIEAAGLDVEGYSVLPAFEVDHPFMYLIVKESSQNERIVLFSGVVREP
ncbi:hypothetical protein QAD02_023957 [Eretmocerus hayati]|uniref:Uncharacterized protein n=1 Tax=Eretmocerus hayati TaxID=131215 RepID=A0ACC2PXG8_9HYME|nr:hypothetical protein QAD02_023957 [Eretmocerus hayati]